jgi:hypothetical protein
MKVGFFICGGCIVIMGPMDFVRERKCGKMFFFFSLFYIFFWSPLSYVRFLQHFVGKNFLLPFNCLITKQPKFFNPSFSSFSLLVLLPIYYIFFFFLYFEFFFEKATSTLTQREELISDFEMCVLIVERVENKFFNLKLF